MKHTSTELTTPATIPAILPAALVGVLDGVLYVEDIFKVGSRNGGGDGILFIIEDISKGGSRNGGGDGGGGVDVGAGEEAVQSKTSQHS